MRNGNSEEFDNDFLAPNSKCSSLLHIAFLHHLLLSLCQALALGGGGKQTDCQPKRKNGQMECQTLSTCMRGV